MPPPDRYPERDRRGDPARPDTGERRRESDRERFENDVRAWMREHDRWARDWTTRAEERIQDVEDRADLLDGRGLQRGEGILGKLGELRGELAASNRELAGVRTELAELKLTASRIDGHTTPPKSRSERFLTILVTVVIPVVIATLPVLGTIIAAWLALKGQLGGVGQSRP